MKVCHAITGEVLEVPRDPWSSAADCLRDRVNAAFSDANPILLTDAGTKVEESLENVELVFFFPRDAYDKPPPVLEVSSSKDAAPAEPWDADLGAGRESDVWASVLEAQQLLRRSTRLVATSAEMRRRLEMQKKACLSVRSNLTNRKSVFARNMELLQEKFHRDHERHQELLKAIESSLVQLGEIRLHAELQAPQRQTLADCIPCERIEEFVKRMREDHVRLENKIESLTTNSSEICKVTDQEDENLHSFEDDRTVEQAIDEQASALDKARPLWDRVLECVNATEAQDVLAAEKVSARVVADLEPVLLEHQEQHQRCLQLWNARCGHFLQRLRDVSYVQTRLRSVELQGVLFSESLRTLGSQLAQASHIAKMPVAYQKALHELARRRQFKQRYLAYAQHAKDVLKRMKDEEDECRRHFMRRHGCHLPTDFLPGLDTLPPAPVLEVASFDEGLPEVDIPPEEAKGPDRSQRSDPSSNNSSSKKPTPPVSFQEPPSREESGAGSPQAQQAAPTEATKAENVSEEKAEPERDRFSPASRSVAQPPAESPANA